jgi:hypothetical protein
MIFRSSPFNALKRGRMCAPAGPRPMLRHPPSARVLGTTIVQGADRQITVHIAVARLQRRLRHCSCTDGATDTGSLPPGAVGAIPVAPVSQPGRADPRIVVTKPTQSACCWSGSGRRPVPG